MKAVIRNIVNATAEVKILELAAADGSALPPYEPGAHLDVTLPNGITRQYSLCCATPSPQRYRIAVKREPQSRGGSAWLHDAATEGTHVEIGAPRNAFSLVPGAAAHLLFAGGIGITPVLSMAHALARRGLPFRLAVFARAAELVPFADELESPPLGPSCSVHCALGPDDTGLKIDALLAAAADGTHVYACGPAAFMDAVTARAVARFGPDAVHTESFGAAAPAAGDRPFVLRLVQSAREIAVPADRTALACLQEAGIDIDSSCEVGVCGTCLTRVRDGEADHRDSYLTTAERAGCFLPCVSRAVTPVLEIEL
ncbi:PDR/VanB family oxidoreductase [Pseudoduganella umbonata]|uniref:Oxidoreductase n=1 Tax=Pseudoduganella umbonata TaxID=864828 RepID=A0A4P8HMN7_9BURK|nr:PDR/VanB family oxidoreductase [Pseudoduganella umbonata]MBB3219547.1 vanillate O-demethylase ferredoxin subunit [Pseudoduganella umbonata]QCP09620.1 oxidoreductase [Pseudoduganella umbonata]